LKCPSGAKCSLLALKTAPLPPLDFPSYAYFSSI
jgi:hypothetical protein